jgi:hypothetical protein
MAVHLVEAAAEGKEHPEPAAGIAEPGAFAGFA